MAENDKDKEEAELEEGEGEVMAFIGDMEEDSRSIMKDLIYIDGLLLTLQEKLETEEIDKNELLRRIEEIRLKIGILERKDRIEIGEEEEAETLLNKIKKWVDKVV